MTGNTEVDTGELRTFARGMHGRADAILGASEHLRSLDYGVATFGPILNPFVSAAAEAAGQASEGLMFLSRNVGIDATAVLDAAIDYETNEQDQVHRFRGGSHG